jgi:SAM-dependent methyltransferase
LIGQNWILAVLLASQNRPGMLRPLSRLKAGPYRYDKQQWENEFASGGWDFLVGPVERHRNAVLAGCIDSYAPQGSILEVGCGTGALHQAVRLHRHQSYLGVDVSETAIARAKETQDDRSSFLVAPAETFEPEARFDAIVFAETLYYLADPEARQSATATSSRRRDTFLFRWRYAAYATDSGNSQFGGICGSISTSRTKSICIFPATAARPRLPGR